MILSLRMALRIKAVKNVTYNEPQFTGHFPSRPIFPGIYLIEGMAQTAGAICVAAKIAERAKPKQVFFMTVDKCKFRKPVQPGDTVEYHMRKLNTRRNMWWYRGEAKVLFDFTVTDGVVQAITFRAARETLARVVRRDGGEPRR